jgi:hypothetical protein
MVDNGQLHENLNKTYAHVELDFRHLRPLECLRMERITKFDTLHHCYEFLQELVIDGILHVYASTRTARLALVGPNRTTYSVSSDRGESKTLVMTHRIPNAAHLAALSKLQSSKISVGDLPPSSSVTRLRLLEAAAFMIARPTAVPITKICIEQTV